jgi:hypothetical protein
MARVASQRFPNGTEHPPLRPHHRIVTVGRHLSHGKHFMKTITKCFATLTLLRPRAGLRQRAGLANAVFLLSSDSRNRILAVRPLRTVRGDRFGSTTKTKLWRGLQRVQATSNPM